jgi:hypothetical protein
VYDIWFIKHFVALSQARRALNPCVLQNASYKTRIIICMYTIVKPQKICSLDIFWTVTRFLICIWHLLLLGIEEEKNSSQHKWSEHNQKFSSMIFHRDDLSFKICMYILQRDELWLRIWWSSFRTNWRCWWSKFLNFAPRESDRSTTWRYVKPSSFHL